MADNFLERHRADYEQRKARWLKRKSRCSIKVNKPKPSNTPAEKPSQSKDNNIGTAFACVSSSEQ